MMKTHSEFINDLIKEFPDTKDVIMDEDNLNSITLQMICFKVTTQKAIDEKDWELVKRHFIFINNNIENVEQRLENALVLTYLAHLKITHNSTVQSLLPLKLKNIIRQIENYQKKD